MLRDFESNTMIPTADLATARRFYEDSLGFAPNAEDSGFVNYSSGSSPDVRGRVAELAGNGASFER